MKAESSRRQGITIKVDAPARRRRVSFFRPEEGDQSSPLEASITMMGAPEPEPPACQVGSDLDMGVPRERFNVNETDATFLLREEKKERLALRTAASAIFKKINEGSF